MINLSNDTSLLEDERTYFDLRTCFSQFGANYIITAAWHLRIQSTPWKTNILNPENGGLEDDFPFLGDF